jgi:hypothetical protein
MKPEFRSRHLRLLRYLERFLRRKGLSQGSVGRVFCLYCGCDPASVLAAACVRKLLQILGYSALHCAFSLDFQCQKNRRFTLL